MSFDHKKTSLASRLLGIVFVGAQFFQALAVRADDGFYVSNFDPVQQSQLDAALKSIEFKSLDRVLLVPDLSYQGVESLETRWKLLNEAAKLDSRLVIPSLKDLKTLQATNQWEAFWTKYPPLEGKYHPLVEDFSPHSSIASMPRQIRGTKIEILNFGEEATAHSASIKLTSKANQTKRFHLNPAMNEGLLPENVAQVIRQESLYGHDGSRGYYGLPRWLTKQIDLEQKLNDRIEDLSTFASINESDLPRSYYPEERPVFKMLHVDVPVGDIRLLKTGALPEGVEILVGNNKFLRFFVHPHSKKLYKNAFKGLQWKEEFWATPTSSHRSLIVWNPLTKDPPFGVKSTLDATIGGSLRHLSESQIERASASSALLNTLDFKELERRGILFIDEPLGVVLKSTEHGFAIRSLVAPTQSRVEFIPMFSLYSKPPGRNPIVVDMVKKSGMSAQDFVRKFIMKPLVDHYNYLSWTQGFIGEPHEQNLLMEVRDGLPTGRIYYRDLAGFHIKPNIRQAAGLDMSFLPAGIKNDSLKFDRADIVGNAVNYLRRSNFFAMTKALKVEFPEITKEFVDQEFRELMSQNVSHYSGVRVDHTMPSWKAAVEKSVQEGFPSVRLAPQRNQTRVLSRSQNCLQNLKFFLQEVRVN